MFADAQSNSAVVINQSFGYNTINADDLQFMIDNFGGSYSTSQLLQLL